MSIDRLWAPWRSDYVTGAAAGGGNCLFCALSAPGGDSENLVLCRTSRVLAVLNRYPYINGHMMVAPLRHVAWLSELEPAEAADLFDTLADSERALREGMRCAGVNGGWNIGRCAGAGVEGHLHVHILPRWPGDVNFMTTTAGTRVLSESLESTRDRLAPFFGS